MRACLASLLIASAAAFAPAGQTVAKSALAATPFEKEVGAQAPVGYFEYVYTRRNDNYACVVESSQSFCLSAS